MHTDPLPVFGTEAIQNLIIESYKASQQTAARIELQRQPGFREVNLYADRSSIQWATNIRLSFMNQIRKKLIA